MSDELDHLRKDRRTYRLAGSTNRSITSVGDEVGHVDDLVAGYVLGALETEETAAVDVHVRTCPSCEVSLADAQRTASMLPLVVPVQKAPLDSKVALFARVAQAQRAAAYIDSTDARHRRLAHADPAKLGDWPVGAC